MEEIYGISVLISHYKDNDAILNILTKTSLYKVLLRGGFNIKNKNLIFTKPFIEGNYELYKGKVGGYKFKSCEVIDYHDKISASFKKVLSLNIISEVILKVCDGIDDFEILFNKFKETLSKLENNNEFQTINEFLSKITCLLGINPLFENTNSDINYFSIKDGRFLKPPNDYSILLNGDETEYLKSLYYKNDYDLNKKEIDKKKITRLLLVFIEDKMSIRLNCLNLF